VEVKTQAISPGLYVGTEEVELDDIIARLRSVKEFE
jgi:hypothetical protein